MYSYAYLAAVAVAVLPLASATGLELPESFKLAKRQAPEPGTPQFACHAACGGIIRDARTEGYCTSATYAPALESCLLCAQTYDIWRFYSDGVSAAAQGCGGTAVPSPSGAAAAASTGAAGSAISSAVDAATSLVATTPAETTAAPTDAAGSSSASEAAATSLAETIVQQPSGGWAAQQTAGVWVAGVVGAVGMLVV